MEECLHCVPTLQKIFKNLHRKRALKKSVALKGCHGNQSLRFQQ